MSKFEDAFYGELEKVGFGMKSYPKPGTKEDERHWNRRRRLSLLLGGLAARKGRKLRTIGGDLLGGAVGRVAGQAIGRVAELKTRKQGLANAGGALGNFAGRLTGTYLGHGKYDKKVSKREYEIWKAKQRAKGKK